MKRTYYKSFDENLCGMNGFQYEVGKAFMADTDDPFQWLHFASKVNQTLRYYCKGIRICEVEPLGKVNRYAAWDMNTDCLHIIRELTTDEIIIKLLDEKCGVAEIINFEPSFNLLRVFYGRLRHCDKLAILSADYLTPEQKKALLPKCWEREVDIREGAETDCQ